MISISKKIIRPIVKATKNVYSHCICPIAKNPDSAVGMDDLCSLNAAMAQKNTILGRFLVYKKNLRGIEPLSKNFPSEDAAIGYAKQQILPRLNTGDSHEYAVAIDIDCNRVLREFVGRRDSVGVDVPEMLNPKNKIALVHGHPNFDGYSCTNTVSWKDFLHMNSHPGEHKCIALNSDGEYSLLEKLENAKPLDKNQIDEFEELHLNYWMENLSEDAKKALSKLSLELADKTEEEASVYLPLVTSILNKSRHTPEYAVANHKFWSENAESIGVKYKTNYSYL